MGNSLISIVTQKKWHDQLKMASYREWDTQENRAGDFWATKPEDFKNQTVFLSQSVNPKMAQWKDHTISGHFWTWMIPASP